ncbi:hypothetical protein MMC18_008546 [Xylographa bjoerkii]|nr:hypothetical protein [Xylographa bjoerkii]
MAGALLESLTRIPTREEYESAVLQIYADDFHTSGATTPSRYTDPKSCKSLAYFADTLSVTEISLYGSEPEAGDKRSFENASLTVTPTSGTPIQGLTFTTNPSLRKGQFGYEADFGRAGFHGKSQGQIYALATEADWKISMGDFLRMIGYKVASWVNPLLEAIELKPRASTDTDHPKSGLWYLPLSNFSSVLRMEMEISNVASGAKRMTEMITSFFHGTSLNKIFCVGKKTASIVSSAADKSSTAIRSEIIFFTTLNWTLDNTAVSLTLFMLLHDDGIKLIAQLPPGQQNPWIALIKWLEKILEKESPQDKASMDPNVLEQALKSLGDTFIPRQISLTLGKDRKLTDFSIDFETPLKRGAPPGKSVSVLSSFAWSPGKFSLSGELFCPLSLVVFSVPREVDPFWEAYLDFEPTSASTAIDYLSLPYLFDPVNPIQNIPKGIPTEILGAKISVTLGKETIVSLEGTLLSGPEDFDSPVPAIELDSLSLFATFNTKSPGHWSLLLTGEVELNPISLSASNQESVILSVSIARQEDGSWRFGGGVNRLTVAHLADFFDDDSSVSVMTIMSELQLRDMNISYKYKTSTPSSFILTGTLWLGPVALELSYEHQGSTWTFDANLYPSNAAGECRLGDLLKEILGNTSSVPDFVTSLSIPMNQLAIDLKCYRTSQKDGFLVFSIAIRVGSVYISFVQLKDETVPVTGGGPGPKPLKMLRFALNRLPTIEKIPLLARIEQPFDQMDFIWLNKDATKAEVDLLNKQTFPPEAQLMFQGTEKKIPPQQPATGPAKSSTVLTAGSHFQIIIHEGAGTKVILDYNFGKPSPSTPPPGTGGKKSQAVATTIKSSAPSETATKGTDPSTDSTASPLVPLNKKQGPLSISTVGMKYEKDALHIILGGTVQLGPLEFMVEGLKLIVHLGKGFSLHDWHNIKLDVEIMGLGIELKKGKLQIAGLFTRIHDETQVGFAGGLSVGFQPYSFLAAGAYTEQTAGYKSVFAFAMLKGPLMEFGWAEVRGITGGFGYNSTIRLPRITEVMSFPLISNELPDSSDPLQQLAALTKTSGDAWIKPLDKTLWIAAGLTVKALQLLDVQAVVTVEIGQDLRIGLIGDVIATFPKGGTVNSDHLFLLLDLQIVASIDFGKGAVQIEGQLSPASFILSHACHPVGGFALYAWFHPSEHAGDWVFSVGGYHPAYQRPPHYPNPPRLGISWKYDSHLSISGGAYFAITPKMCMGGGQLSAVFELGCISANFDAHADMLMNYQPFHYDVEIGVSMNVRFQLKILFVTVKFSVHVGADITINGPPMAGKAHIDLSVINFTISFGASPPQAKPLLLGEFWALVKQSSAADGSQPKDNHVITVSQGLLPSDEEDSEFLGVVRPGILQLQIHSSTPLGEANYGKQKAFKDDKEKIFAKPMRKNGPLGSSFNVTIQRLLDDGTDSDETFAFTCEQMKRPYPIALWTQYNPNKDPKDNGDNSSVLRSTDQPYVNLLSGLTLKAPLSHTSPEKIPPFSPAELFESTIHNVHEVKTLDEELEHFRASKEKADKARLRGLWGNGTSTARVDMTFIYGAFAQSYSENEKETANRYMHLPTAPPTEMFKSFDLHFSCGDPGLTPMQEEEEGSYKGIVAGRWSLSEMPAKKFDESTVSGDVDFPAFITVAQKKRLPQSFLGFSKIDLNHTVDRGFAFSAKPDWNDMSQRFIGCHVRSSRIRDVDLSWLTSFGDKAIQTGIGFLGPPSTSGILQPLRSLDLIPGMEVNHRRSPDTTFTPNGHVTDMTIDFPIKYAAAPKVVVALAGLAYGTDPPRVKFNVKEITTDNFRLEVFTPRGLQEDMVLFNWLAHPDAHPDIESGTLFSENVRPLGNSSAEQNLTFTAGKFDAKNPPQVFVSFSDLDTASWHPLRTQVSVKDASHLGFKWAISTWGGSSATSAKANWIAIRF